MTAVQFEELPYEILQAILGYLPLQDLLPISTLSKTLYSLSLAPSLTAFLPPIHRALLRGPPYPGELAKLGCYTHISRTVFIEILVRAKPRWILDEMIIPTLPESTWQGIVSRRFLPSWKRFKEKGERWRGFYMKMLRRLVHRELGCTHEEAWTRFLIIHRNGTGSLNRIASSQFTPLTILPELLTQNNLSQHYPQTRLLLQLSDVKILLFGVLASPISVFVNEKAFRVCHPPRLRESGYEREVDDEGNDIRVRRPVIGRTRSMSAPMASSRQSERTSLPEAQQPPIPSPFITSSTRIAPPPLAGPSTRTRRSSSTLTRILKMDRRSSSGSIPPRNALPFPDLPSARSSGSQERIIPRLDATDEESENRKRTGPEIRNDSAEEEVSTFEPDHDLSRKPLPYKPLSHPLPAPSHTLFPNFTPENYAINQADHSVDPISDSLCGERKSVDTRQKHKVMRERKWLEGVIKGGGEEGPSEWVNGEAKVWVGPVLLMAQLNHSHHQVDWEDGPATAAKLGPAGMYASFDWEDFEAIFPWVQFGHEGDNPDLHGMGRRDGLGFGD